MLDPITEYILHQDEKYISEITNIFDIAVYMRDLIKKHQASKTLVGKAKEFAGKHPTAVVSVSMALVVAAAIAASIKLYKQFISKAEKACKDKKGQEKADCMKNYKIKGKEKQIKNLKKAMTFCKETKKPDSCKKRLEKKIDEITKQINKLKK